MCLFGLSLEFLTLISITIKIFQGNGVVLKLSSNAVAKSCKELKAVGNVKATHKDQRDCTD